MAETSSGHCSVRAHSPTNGSTGVPGVWFAWTGGLAGSGAASSPGLEHAAPSMITSTTSDFGNRDMFIPPRVRTRERDAIGSDRLGPLHEWGRLPGRNEERVG